MIEVRISWNDDTVNVCHVEDMDNIEINYEAHIMWLILKDGSTRMVNLNQVSLVSFSRKETK